MERSKRTRKVPYKLRDFHIELVDFRHQIRYLDLGQKNSKFFNPRLNGLALLRNAVAPFGLPSLRDGFLRGGLKGND